MNRPTNEFLALVLAFSPKAPESLNGHQHRCMTMSTPTPHYWFVAFNPAKCAGSKAEAVSSNLG
ncbi:hypothetical protein GB937_005537 [Aspergillus fischeri]|nr:hypothetical protein GB937_005537 [Aspergillus fischeri]